MKDVKNIQQFYDLHKVHEIAGYDCEDPQKIKDMDFDMSIVDGTSTPVYRAISNDLLMKLFEMQAISVEQLLEHGDFPFADGLLQSIKSQKERMQQGEAPEGLSPQLAAQAQQGADMQAVAQAQQMLAA